ncbi:MAG TPA: ATP-binding cassette domain-containing protein, partial [Clostridia bacterium]|nr:ATP-binding cassette domain-containing protein [Clostridia bacterium]
AQQRQKEIVKNLKTRTELLEERGRARTDGLLDEANACPSQEQAILIKSVLCVDKPPEDEDIPPIVIDQVSKCFGSAYVFSDYCASLPLDKPLVIIGPSGVGKTTLMRMMAGLVRPDSGEIRGVPERGVFVFQDNRLLPQLSARDNIRLVLPGYDGEWADNLLASLDLSGVKDQPASTLSGGEMRRLALARALAPESDILYLDEVFRELDEMHENDALSVLLQVAGNKPIIVATHDLSLIGRLNANILELRK